MDDDKYSYTAHSYVGKYGLTWQREIVKFFPLIFGSRCDAGKMHFWTDADDAGAQNLGFLPSED